MAVPLSRMATLFRLTLLFVLFLGTSTALRVPGTDRAFETGGLDRIRVRGRWLVDSYGRVRIFHGFNSVLKHPPWYDQQILNSTQLQYFKEWGFNAVRLGAMWSGFEPAKGQYNQTYFDIIKSIVNKLGSYGLYVLLDMHQDEFSSLFNAYDGIPLWVAKSFPPPDHPFPWPFKSVGPSSPTAYLTQACSGAFQHLYDNTAGARDAMRDIWVRIAENFKDNTNVLGYEFINEPFAGDFYNHPTLLLPGEAGKINLMPMYDELANALRKVDNHTLVFYEPVTWGVWLNGTILGTGFNRVPGGPEYADRSVLSWHYYCWILTSGPAESRPYPFLERWICDDELGKHVFKNVVYDTAKIGGASFMTEFGKCEPNKYENSTGNIECDYIMNSADEYLQSWTYWDNWIFFSKDRSVNWTAVTPFTRPYARATAGIPVKMSFQSTQKNFEFNFVPDVSVKAPTEIFIPKRQYPNGINVAVSSGLDYSYDKTSNILTVKPVTTNEAELQPNAVASVTVTPKI